MQRYLEDRTKLALYQIVDLIDAGKSRDAAKKLGEKEDLQKLKKTDPQAAAKIIDKQKEKEQKKKSKKDKKDKKKKKKKMSKKDKEKKVSDDRRQNMMRSTISGGLKQGKAQDDQEYERKRK